jgi:hypothetical protein
MLGHLADKHRPIPIGHPVPWFNLVVCFDERLKPIRTYLLIHRTPLFGIKDCNEQTFVLRFQVVPL